jgi:NADPH-dependent glutamate synthase beta subunit-like oxidoreductase/CO/xanthine dehydrogenase FAD-binding subunit
MALREFEHLSATSVADAAAAVVDNQPDTALIAGGTDLLGILKDRVHPSYPKLVVDLKRIPGLGAIRLDEKGLTIGALCTLGEVAKSPVVKEHCELLGEAARAVASPQIRNQGTVGGNICQEPRCWYYRAPDNRFHCLRKGGDMCGAVLGENRFHSLFGAAHVGAPPCSTGCPGEVAIPAYLEQVRAGRLAEAAAILLERNPMPAVTGRVCPHFCELACSRRDYDEAVSVRSIERHVGDYALANAATLMPPPSQKTGKKVAVVGAGPAGLAAAYYLRRAGHEVTVFDRQPEAGGMLTYCIPAYRLPKEIVARLVQAYRNMGIELRLGTEVGSGKAALKRLRQKFDGVFLATGAWKQKQLRMEREEMLVSGIDFLTRIQLEGGKAPGRKVLVIGGGNVAVDVAISALRLGAREVTMACLEARDAMPAIPEDIEQAVREGIKLLPSWGPHRILERGGRLTGLELVQCTSVFDGEGRFRPTFDPEAKMTVEADAILLAIGQDTELGYLDRSTKTERGLIVVDEQTQATSVDGVFAGGDVVTGPASVVEALAAGRKAALAISARLAAGKVAPAKAPRASDQPLHALTPSALEKSRRVAVPELDVSQRTVRGEDVATLDARAVETESYRCAHCGCVAVNASDLAPALVALGAKIKTSKQTIDAEQFFAARPFSTTVLAPGEVVTEIQIPAPPPGARMSFQKFRLRKSIDFPIVSLASSLVVERGTVQEATLALGAVAPVPLRARQVEKFLVGKRLTEENIEIAESIAVKGVFPLGKNRYKVQLVKALLRKALEAAARERRLHVTR